MGNLTWILYVILAAGVTYEAVAHFILHNKGMETASHIVLGLEKKYGLWMRILVAVSTLLLGVHLEGAF